MDNTKFKIILLISSLPPPDGGVSSLTEIMMRTEPRRPYFYKLINTSIWPRVLFDDTPFNFAELKRLLRIITSTYKVLHRDKPSLLHFNFTPSRVSLPRDFLLVLIARHFHTPIAIHFHGDLVNTAGSYGFIRLSLLKFILNHSNVNILLNKHSFDKAKQMASNIPARYLPNFVERTPNNPNLSKQPSQPFPLTVFVGGISEGKGVSELLKAAILVDKMRFKFIGNFTSGMKLKCNEILIKNNLIDRVEFCGGINHQQVLHEMWQSDIFCLPSHKEGFPITVLEAMACGLPVIGTDVGAIPDLIEDGRGGFLSPVRDVEALANNLIKLRDNPVLCNQMGAYNKQKIELNYTYDVIKEKLALIYDEFCI